MDLVYVPLWTVELAKQYIKLELLEALNMKILQSEAKCS